MHRAGKRADRTRPHGALHSAARPSRLGDEGGSAGEPPASCGRFVARPGRASERVRVPAHATDMSSHTRADVSIAPVASRWCDRHGARTARVPAGKWSRPAAARRRSIAHADTAVRCGGGGPAQSVTLHTDFGDIKIELLCDLAPKACENFLALCASGYYDGCVFHRNIKNFILQTGDPTGTVPPGPAVRARRTDAPGTRTRTRRNGKGRHQYMGREVCR